MEGRTRRESGCLLAWLLPWITLSVVVLLVAACAHPIPLQPSIERPPAVTQIPLSVGVYYTREFSDFAPSLKEGEGPFFFPVGKASVALFNQAFTMMFESAPPVTSPPPLSPDGPKVAAVIQPHVERFRFYTSQYTDTPHIAEITYRITLYSVQGDQILSWTATGTAAKPRQRAFELLRELGETVDLAMRDAAVKFLTVFPYLPEIHRWLREAGFGKTAGMPAPIPVVVRRR